MEPCNEWEVSPVGIFTVCTMKAALAAMMLRVSSLPLEGN